MVAALHFGLAAAAPLLRSDLDLDTATLGLLLATPPLGLMLGTFLWGELADRLDERHVLTTAFVGFTIATGLAAVAYHAGSTIWLGIALLASGAFGSAAHSAGGRAIAAAWPVERHGLVLSIRHTAIPIGGAIGGLLVPGLAQAHGFATAIGVMAVLGAFAAAGVWLAIPSTRMIATAGHPVEAGGSPLRELRLWLLCVGCASLAFVQLGIGSFLTIQLVGEADLSITTATAIFTTSFLVAAAGRVVLGIWSDRLGNRLVVLRRVAIVTGLLLLPTLVGVSSRMDGALYVLALVVVTSCNGVAVAVASTLAPPGRTGATLGMQTTCNAAACTIAPVVLGAALEFGGWRTFEVVLLAVVVLSLTCLAALRRVTSRPVVGLVRPAG